MTPNVLKLSPRNPSSFSSSGTPAKSKRKLFPCCSWSRRQVEKEIGRSPSQPSIPQVSGQSLPGMSVRPGGTRSEAWFRHAAAAWPGAGVRTPRCRKPSAPSRGPQSRCSGVTFRLNATV